MSLDLYIFEFNCEYRLLTSLWLLFEVLFSFPFLKKCLRLTYFLTETHRCLTVTLAFPLNITLRSVLFSISVVREFAGICFYNCCIIL